MSATATNALLARIRAERGDVEHDKAVSVCSMIGLIWYFGSKAKDQAQRDSAATMITHLHSLVGDVFNHDQMQELVDVTTDDLNRVAGGL